MALADAPLGYPADATTTVPTTHAPTIILQMKMRWYDPGGDIAMPRTVSIMTSRMVLSIFNIPPVGCDVPDCKAASLSENCKVKLAGLVTSAIKYLDRSLNCFPRACDQQPLDSDR